jgi:hypothetical protein
LCVQDRVRAMDAYVAQMRELVLVRDALTSDAPADAALLRELQPDTLALVAQLDNPDPALAREPPRPYVVEATGSVAVAVARARAVAPVRRQGVVADCSVVAFLPWSCPFLYVIRAVLDKRVVVLAGFRHAQRPSRVPSSCWLQRA